MSGLTTVKQDELIDSGKVGEWKVKIFGAGSVGSIMAVQLAKTGFHDITLYDFDEVETENVGSQEYRNEHVGMKKTDAIKKLLKDDYDYDIRVVDGKLTEETEILPEENTIYFCAFDSLEARKLVWDKIKSFPVVWGESRIGRFDQRYYLVDLRNRNEQWIKEYEATLSPDGPMTDLKCGEKGTYCSTAELVSKIIKQLVNIAEENPHRQMFIGAWGGGMSIYREPKQDVPAEIVYGDGEEEKTEKTD